MRAATLLAGAAALLSASTRPAVAQGAATPVAVTALDSLAETGARVRVEPRGAGRRRTGTLAPAPRDSVRLVGGAGDTLVLARADVGRLDVSRGRSRQAGAARGALIGAAIPGVPGAAATWLLWYDGIRCERRQQSECYLGAGIVGVLTVAYALNGAAIGGVVGALVGRERWEPVLPPRVGVGVVPSGRGAALAVRVTF